MPPHSFTAKIAIPIRNDKKWARLSGITSNCPRVRILGQAEDFLTLSLPTGGTQPDVLKVRLEKASGHRAPPGSWICLLGTPL